MENGFEGKENQVIPEMPDEFVWEISKRYIELYETMTGLTFEKSDLNNIPERIYNNVSAYLDNKF
jgi:phosphoribosylaminoimidazole-succinocarboxamide synthase